MQDRGFDAVNADCLGLQTGYERFSHASHAAQVPNGALEQQLPEDQDDFWDSDFESVSSGDQTTPHMPRISEWAMNLTALSQVHNLYFAAYGSELHVFSLERQVATGSAALILRPSKSAAAMTVPCYTQRTRLHTINHVLVGNLGILEIVLVAFDDGDVVAYYTNVIDQVVEDSTLDTPPMPFFRENVGNGAWGLAIHSRTRLIAVSSNNHEVQVFAFALHTDTPVNPPYSNLYYTDTFFLADNSMTWQDTLWRDRSINFKIILKLPAIGHNIPAISFADNVDGDADVVVAKDIKGELWLLCLRGGDWFRLPTGPGNGNPANFEPLGWGVMVLPSGFFKPTRTPTETYGCPESWVVRRTGYGLDISPSVFSDTQGLYYEVPEDVLASIPSDTVEDWDLPFLLDRMQNRLTQCGLSPKDLLIFEQVNSTCPSGGQVAPRGDFTVTTPVMEKSYGMTPYIAQDQICESPRCYHSGLVPGSYPFPPSTAYRGKTQNRIDLPFRGIYQHIAANQVILHTNRHDIFLQPSTPAAPSTSAFNTLRQDWSHTAQPFPRLPSDYDRLNMLAAIPDLSLIIAASQTGRVALITITRAPATATDPRRHNSSNTNERAAHTFRIDRILPSADDEAHGLRPACALLGMAVAPLWCGRRPAASLPRSSSSSFRQDRSRWRLMLHYVNHGILSYEISRSDEMRAVMI